MQVSRIRALRGPNLWTRHTAVEALVRCEGDELDLSSRPEFETHLRQLFPGLGLKVVREHLGGKDSYETLRFIEAYLQQKTLSIS